MTSPSELANETDHKRVGDKDKDKTNDYDKSEAGHLTQKHVLPPAVL